MTTQQAVASEQQPTASGSARRPGAALIIAAAALAVLGLAAASWFLLLSPHSSTVALTADASAAAPGKAVPISGRVTPAAPNRIVEIFIGSTASGPFARAGTAVTDATGGFSATWSPTRAGTTWVRATAATLGRDQQALSAPVSVTVRTPATLTLRTAATAIRTTGNTSVTATLTPAGGRVTFQESTDGQTWTPMPGAASPSTGVATIKVSALAGGLWHFRATAAQTDTATAATGREVTVLVEDYKAAGAKYLQLVARTNSAIEESDKLMSAGASLATLTAQDDVISRDMSDDAVNFRAYTGWPRAVAPLVADLAKQDVLEADYFHMRSQSRSIDEWDQFANQTNAFDDAGSADAATIRDLLGLPKRSLHP